MTHQEELELQNRFINENMDILQKYLIWKEFISEEPQILNTDVNVEAQDVDFKLEDVKKVVREVNFGIMLNNTKTDGIIN